MAKHNWPEGTRTESFGFLLQVLAKRADRKVKARLDELGFEFRYFPYLMFLVAKDGQSQRELGQHLGDPEYQTSRNLDAMGKAELIERQPSPTSRRTTLVCLTPKGRALAERLPPLIRQANDGFLASLSSEERDQLLNTMQKLVEETDG